MAKKRRQKERKGKKTPKKTIRKKKSEYYEVKGDSVKRIKQFCSKCGPGVFMAEHKDRLTCGKCHYTQWKK